MLGLSDVLHVHVRSQFVRLVLQRDLAAFDEWIAPNVGSEVADLANVATGLRQDESAVRAPLTMPWSTGPVERQIIRLNMLKRQSL